MSDTDRPAAADVTPGSAATPSTGHRQRPTSAAFKRFIASGWAPRDAQLPSLSEVAPYAAARRDRLSLAFPGDRLVIPAGVLRVRSNDTDHRFRPHSAFAHLTGFGTDQEPDAVLVLEPRPAADPRGGHEALLYFKPRAERDTEEFYADARYGELWVGPRPTLDEVTARTGLATRQLDELEEALAKDVGSGEGTVRLRVVRGADPRIEEIVDRVRGTSLTEATEATETTETTETTEAAATTEKPTPDAALLTTLDELRLVKDEWEVGQLRLAIEVTARGFEDIVRALPAAMASPRGERVVETAFEARARHEGNGLGYDTIAAAGPHACTLHWIRNDGPVHEGDLVLIDAGAEVDSLYTADVTRTIPVSGTFTPAQRQVYDAVLEAADAAFAVARPGSRFRDLNAAAMAVIAARLHDWGLIPGTVEESLDKDGQYHRRWMVHGTSHHLGLDVHDCAKARQEMYMDAELVPGMVFTIEPGLYFMPDDLLAPQELRGIGVRIEDDVLVTQDGCVNLSGLLPRSAADVEEWLASLR